MAALIRKNLSLIGPPGSGKGSYGRYFAKHLDIPLVTVSDVLRQRRPEIDLASGDLVDCQVVSEALLEDLHGKQGYLLDGFPRTLKQLQIMEDMWPSSMQVQAAVSLEVPDRVCETKLLGRRLCRKCGGNYNCNEVNFDGWHLPASLPKDCPHSDCDPSKDWRSREDDKPDVVQDRLKVHHQHMDPIVDYFESKQSLFRYSPKHGYDDVPKMQSALERWLKDLSEEKVSSKVPVDVPL
jgi:adenylate kinase